MRIRLAVFFCWTSVATGCLADYEISVPGYSSIFIANQLNNNSNTLDNIFGRQLPAFSAASFWNCCDASPTNFLNTCYRSYVYDPTDPDGLGPGAPLWYEMDDATPADPNDITVVPGHGVLIYNNGPATILTFFGTPNIPVLPAALPCGFGYYNLLGRQTNDVGTYENVTGLMPHEGAQVLRWNPVPANFTTYTFSSGAWTPGTPALDVGEAAFFLVPSNIVVASYSTIMHMITITWEGGGVLQQADQPNGSWTDVPGGDVSPCALPIEDAQIRFYRVRYN